jgi:hypothetical protein
VRPPPFFFTYMGGDSAMFQLAALEPTRSVLHRSAPTLALECGALRDAERLIAVALSGDPPAEIAEELRDLLEQVYFGSKKGGRRGYVAGLLRER